MAIQAESCSALRVLELRTCRQVSDDSLTKLAAKCLGLQRVSITDCTPRPLLIQPRPRSSFAARTPNVFIIINSAVS